MEAIIAKEVALVCTKTKKSIRYQLTGNKDTETEKSSVVLGKTTSRYFRMSLLQAALENLFEPLKG